MNQQTAASVSTNNANIATDTSAGPLANVDVDMGDYHDDELGVFEHKPQEEEDKKN